MTQYLPANLLALFTARPPIPFKPPVDKLKKRKNQVPYSAVSHFTGHFENLPPPPATRGETREEFAERKKEEKKMIADAKLQEKQMLWDPHSDQNARGDPFKTLFVARINFDTTESKLRRELESYGPIRQISMLYNIRNRKPRGYAFVEYEHERDMHSAYKHADGKKIDGRRILVDVERGRTVKSWRPRRLGGGLGGTRRGGPDDNIRHSGRVEQWESSGSGREKERGERGERDRGEERSRKRSRSPRERRDRDRDRDRDREREKRRDRGDRGDRGDREEREDRGERGERASRDDRPERAERAEPSEDGAIEEFPEPGEREDRGDREERDDRGEREERDDREERKERGDRGERDDEERDRERRERRRRDRDRRDRDRDRDRDRGDRDRDRRRDRDREEGERDGGDREGGERDREREREKYRQSRDEGEITDDYPGDEPMGRYADSLNGDVKVKVEEDDDMLPPPPPPPPPMDDRHGFDKYGDVEVKPEEVCYDVAPGYE